MDEQTLSARQAEIAAYYVDGLSYKEIARSLGISPGTVRTHLNAIYRKLEISSRIELTRRLLSAAVPPAPEAAPALAVGPRRWPERRQITFLCAEIVGSTRILSNLDAEDMHDLLTRFRAVIREVLERFGGHVAGFPDCAAIAVFDWPAAAEDAPGRAAAAALAMVDAVERVAFASGKRLEIRVGLATGVIVAEGGEGRADDFTGATANLAARLQAVSPPRGVVISDLTHKLITGRFETEALDPVASSDIEGSAPIHLLLRERLDLTRFEMHQRGRRLSPLLGRDADMKMLRNLWRDATSQRGAAVILLGEAGIGKSRLAECFAGKAAEQGATLLRLQTAEGRGSSPLWPVRQAIAATANLDPDAPPAERLRHFQSWLTRVSQAEPLQRNLVAHLLDLVGDEDLPKMSASRRRDFLFDSLLTILLDLSRRAPTILLLEDLHWADPSTLEFVTRLLPALPVAPLLLLMTSRTQDESSFDDPALIQIHLAPLKAGDAEDLVRDRIGCNRFDDEVVAAILARTDGIPLYVEEVTSAMLDGATNQEAVPATLRESLTGRLDRLGSARETAQMAATIGREVDIDLLMSVVGESGAGRVNADIGRLVEAGLISRTRRRITFSHALVQDAAYQSMLRTQRQALHARIAEAMLGRFRHRFLGEPEALAYHLERAGRKAAAVDYYLRAADAVGARAANREAEEFARRALALAEILEGGAERDRRVVAALLSLGRVLTTRLGYGREESAEPLRRALGLAQAAGMRRTEFPLVVSLTAQAGVAGEGVRSLDLALRTTALAEASDDPLHLVMARYAMGVACCWRGERREAVKAFTEGCDAYDSSMHSRLIIVGPQDSGIVCLSRGAANRYLVEPDSAEIERMDAAVSLARSLGHAHSLNYALHWKTMQAIDAEEWERAEAALGETVELAEAHNFVTWKSMSSMTSARFSAGCLSPAEALSAARLSLSMLPEGGNLACMSYVKGLAGDALRQLGRRSEARVLIEEAIDEAERRAIRWALPETLRALARCLLDLDGGDASGAESALSYAVALGRRQGSLLLELRAATDFAELLVEKGDRDAARKAVEGPLSILRASAPMRDRARAEAVLRASL